MTVLKKNDSGLYSIAHECSEYEPIQTIVNLTDSYDEISEESEEESAGCDSCVHYSQSECQIFNRQSSY